MALLIPDVGEVVLLNSMLRTTTPEAQTLKLYKNDISPAEGDTAGTYTESTLGSYAAAALTRNSWGAAATNAGVTSTSYAAQLFSFTSGTEVIVGYYVVGTTSAILLWAERIYPTPGNTFYGANLDTLSITPRMQLD